MQKNTDSKTYIFCPRNLETGGPEALHQLGECLIALGYQVYMHYFDVGIQSSPYKPYTKYNVPIASDVENNEKNILILPETSLSPIFESAYKNTSKIIWWLSVTNYFIIINELKQHVSRKKFYQLKSSLFPSKYKPIPTLDLLRENEKVSHLAHSYFSLDFLQKNNMNIKGKISDYMSDAFYERIGNPVIKEDVIIFNPKKNGVFLQKIIEMTPQLTWIPLINMSIEEVSIWMKKSKLYIDFGYHPGQERMPREAILMGCCVITGKQGSAAFYEDVPLPKGYKFDEDTAPIENIIETIKKCLNNFEEESKSFEDYRIQIHKEKANFRNDVAKVFQKIIPIN